jgi:hypothetical protein
MEKENPHKSLNTKLIQKINNAESIADIKKILKKIVREDDDI